MKTKFLRPVVASLALVAAAASGYLVGVQDARLDGRNDARNVAREETIFHGAPQSDYVRRVIGLPGDRLEIRNKTIFLNGKPFEGSYKAVR
jgi:signal peptidase I